MQIFEFNKKSFSFERYPKTANKSLQAWSAADELMLNESEALISKESSIALYNDRFGFHSVLHSVNKINTVIEYISQEKAIMQNLRLNTQQSDKINQVSPLSALSSKMDVALIKIPKSMEHFELYLQHASKNLKKNGKVVCGFMTKYFSPQMLELSNKFFEKVDQSKAVKKARVLTLSGIKKVEYPEPINEIEYIDFKLKQYYGVFSSNHIDYATQFLIEHLTINESVKSVLDVGCGNGIIGKYIQEKLPKAHFHFMEDSLLAIESCKLNVDIKSSSFHYTDSLSDFEANSLDLIVTNPPFHFDYEINIEVTISLFKEIFRILKTDGKFTCVANMHLNYKTHLEEIFPKTRIVAENKKYVVYECVK